VQGSFDAYSWQTVERKARFINQVMRGRLDVREIEDIGENTLSFAEVKALASGDPLILDKARADAETTRLARLQRAWQRNQHALTHTIAGHEHRLNPLHEQHQAVAAAIDRRRDTRADAFTMTVDGRRVNARADAAALLARWASRLPPERTVPVAQLGGLAVDGMLRLGTGPEHRHVELTLHGLPCAPATLETTRIADSSLSLVRQLEHRIEALPALKTRIEQQQADTTGELERAREQLTSPFKYAQQLDDARAQQTRVTEAMKARTAAPEPAAADQTADVDTTQRAAFPSAASGAITAVHHDHRPTVRPRDTKAVREPARER
jgi:hypothetical protein